jgi:murein DD-endopeptidase MepM/ murein hydrolase activator NlpD
VKWTTRVLPVVVGAGALGTAVTLLTLHYTRGVSHPPPAPPPKPAPPKPVAENLPIKRGDTLDTLLGHAGVEANTRTEMIAAARSVFDVRKLRVGSQLTLSRFAGSPPESLQYVIDPDHELQLSRSTAGYQATVVEIPGEIRAAPVCGVMHGSLFDSIERAGERPELAIQVADIFAWDIDFYSDPREGDDFCVLLEKKIYSNGQPPTYKRILAARYNNAGTIYEGFLFEDGSGKPRYYGPDGRSLQAAFLRSPLRFEARVSSHFSRHRFHPILKIYRPHLGTDYAAPIGAPVQAIASGHVIAAGRSGGAGRMVRIRHANGYETTYMHLSRIFVHVGQSVAQGQRIALVGSSGLSTGPHLDFRIRQHGRYINFERLRPPRATKLDAKQMAAFIPLRDRYSAQLNPGTDTTSPHLARTAE